MYLGCQRVAAFAPSSSCSVPVISIVEKGLLFKRIDWSRVFFLGNIFPAA